VSSSFAANQVVEVRKPKKIVQQQQVTTMKSMQRTIPKFQYDVRTVLVPRAVQEPYKVMETKMVAIQVPKIVMQTKWIQEPREISIPRQIIEKRIIKKLVPKMVEVEEEYEYEVGLTEEEYIEVPHTETRQIEYEDVEVEYEKVPVGQSTGYMQQAYTQPAPAMYASNVGMSAGVMAAIQNVQSAGGSQQMPTQQMYTQQQMPMQQMATQQMYTQQYAQPTQQMYSQPAAAPPQYI